VLLIAPTGWIVLSGIAAGIGYLVWSWNAPPSRLPAGLTGRAQVAVGEGSLRDHAQTLHEAFREAVLEQLGDDLASHPARRLELSAEGWVVSCGVLNPPGLVRVQLEERRAGDRGGVRFVVVVRRLEGDKGMLDLELRGGSSHLFGLPRRASEHAAAAFEDAIARLRGPATGL